ncbi:helix-turn-helix domain-containing protein [Zooshikella sp. RANM57]|uniref:helix-turn-helix domain-containing protein n=1 Tax=Zooshikella sp. RANM57 TaxID=3425863 RepID=UPI003D6E600A
MKRVAILAYDQLALFELGCAVELFALPRPEFDEWYDTKVVTFASGPLTATGAITLNCERVSNLDDFDVIVIPSWPTQTDEIDKNIQQALLKHRAQGKRIITFCSGAFLPAQLGLLDNKQATTHWRYAEIFKKRFPNCHYVDDVLFVYDGQIGCSAGSSAGIDLGIEMIRDDFGYKVANKVARRLVLAAHRSGGQSQYIESPVSTSTNQLSKTLDWAIKNLNQTYDINDLAYKAGMSRRTFDRKFRSIMNMSPNAWLILQRINLAKELLECSTDSVEQISFKVGFESALTFRHHFKRTLNTTPTKYREQFKIKN